MPTIISRSVDETLDVGREWGRQAQKGWVIGLSGDLGSGKTLLVRGLALGLGIRQRVHSPTFALLHEYGGGRLPLFHIDLYRLNSVDEIIGAGLEEYLRRPWGVTAVEWAERWFESEGTRGVIYRSVTVEISGEAERRFSYEDSGN